MASVNRVRFFLMLPILGVVIGIVFLTRRDLRVAEPVAQDFADSRNVQRFLAKFYDEDISYALSLLRDADVIRDFSINSPTPRATANLYLLDVAGFLDATGTHCGDKTLADANAVLACAAAGTCVADGRDLIVCDIQFISLLLEIALARVRMEARYDPKDVGQRFLVGRSVAESRMLATLAATLPAPKRRLWRITAAGILLPVLAHEIGHIQSSYALGTRAYDARIQGVFADATPIADGHTYKVRLKIDCAQLQKAACAPPLEDELEADRFAVRSIVALSDKRSLSKADEHELLSAAGLYSYLRAMYSYVLAGEVSDPHSKHDGSFCVGDEPSISRQDYLAAALAANDVHAHWSQAADRAMQLLLEGSRDLSESERRMYVEGRDRLSCMAQRVLPALCAQPTSAWCSDASVEHTWNYAGLDAEISSLEWWLAHGTSERSIKECIFPQNPYRPDDATKKCYEQARRNKDHDARRVLARMLIASEPVFDPSQSRLDQDPTSKWYPVRRFEYWKDSLEKRFVCPFNISSLNQVARCKKKDGEPLDGREAFILAESRIAWDVTTLAPALCPFRDFEQCMSYMREASREVIKAIDNLNDPNMGRDFAVPAYDRFVAQVYWYRAVAQTLQEWRRLHGTASQVWKNVYILADREGWFQLRQEAACAAAKTGLRDDDLDRATEALTTCDRAQEDLLDLQSDAQ